MSEAEATVLRDFPERKSHCDDAIAAAAGAAYRSMEAVSDMRISLRAIASDECSDAADAVARVIAAHMLAVADDITRHARLLAAAAAPEF